MTDQPPVLGAPSANTPPPLKRMQLVAERRVEETPTPPRPSTLEQTIKTAMATSTPTNPPLAPEIMHRAAWKAGVLGAVNVLVMLLAARLIVLVAIGGAIGLTWQALGNPDPNRLIALGIYGAAVVIPCVWLAARGK